MPEPFTLFNADHKILLIVVMTLAIAIPSLIRVYGSEKSIRYGAILIATLLLLNESTKPFYRYWLFEEPLETVLPLHLCHLSSILAAFTLLWKRYDYFEVLYFWAYGGATIALLTPDVAYTFPDPQFILHFITHGLIMIGVIYASVVYRFRPYPKSIWKAFKISLILTALIFPFNYILGGQSNYFYLRFRPQVGSIMDLLPEPPYHIPYVIILGLIIYLIAYIPYFIKDRVAGPQVESV